MNRKVFLNLIIMVGLLLALVGAQTIPASAQQPANYTLTMVANPPEGGTTDPEPGEHSYPEGTTVSVSATPEEYWRFDGWSGDHADECATGSVVMDADKSCTAVFHKNNLLIISIWPPEGGLITEPNFEDYPENFPDGTSVSIEVVPNTGFLFDGWAGPDADKCASDPLVIYDDIFCTAEFTEVIPPAPGNDHWMADLSEAIQDRTLLDVVLPGTHDSGTYSFTPGSRIKSDDFREYLGVFLDPIQTVTGIGVHQITCRWGKTQATDIERQLNDGIRYFDLRFYKEQDGRFYIHHTMRGPRREVILAAVRAFLIQPDHEKEIIILDLTNWDNMDDADHQDFVNYLYVRFHEWMIPRDDWNATLSEIWASEKQLVIRYQKLDENPQWVPEGVDANLFWTDCCSPWANTPKMGDLQSFLGYHLEHRCGNPDELFVLQGIRTGHGPFVVCSAAYEVQEWLLNHAYVCAIPGWGWYSCTRIEALALPFLSACAFDDNKWPPYRSIWDLGKHTTPYDLQWVTEWWRDCEHGARDNLNIIMVDSYQTGPLLQTVIKLNRGDYNTAPWVDAGPDLEAVEAEEIDLEVQFGDIDTCDEHTATIDWGEGTLEDGIVSESEGSGTVAGSHTYGDNGVYTVKICVRDDFDEACDTLTATVDNVNPTAEIDESTAIPVNGNPTFIGHAGQVLDFSARSTDPGSDDLTMSWDWDDGPPSPDVVTTYLVNPPDADPFPSPSVQPRDVTDLQPHAFADACLYEINFRADDDDGGFAEDSSNAIIVGNGDKMRSDGYWLHQYRQNGATDFDQAALTCYLSIVGYASQVFDEVADASTIEKAHDLLFPKQNEGSATEKFDRELLVAWLNFADGAVGYTQLLDTDKDGIGDTSFADVVAAAEAVRLDGNASDKEIKEQTNILHHINQMAKR